MDVVMSGKRDGEEISRDYLGNYLFAEHLRIDKNRLEITELKPKHTDAKDITGGYLIQQGNQVSKSSPNRFYTNRGFCLLIRRIPGADRIRRRLRTTSA